MPDTNEIYYKIKIIKILLMKLVMLSEICKMLYSFWMKHRGDMLRPLKVNMDNRFLARMVQVPQF